MSSNDVEGLWDIALEAKRWYPMLSLLRRARETDGAEQLEALRDSVAFFMKQMGRDPWASRPFLVFAVVADLYKTDPRVAAIVDEAFPKRR